MIGFVFPTTKHSTVEKKGGTKDRIATRWQVSDDGFFIYSLTGGKQWDLHYDRINYDADGTGWQGRIPNSSIGRSELGTPSRFTGPRRFANVAHDLCCFARSHATSGTATAAAAAAAAAGDDKVSFLDEGDDDDEEYPTDARLALALAAPCTRAVHERHRHDLTLTQHTLMQTTETEPCDANLTTRTRELEKTIALVKHEENPANKLNGVEEEEEDYDLARPGAGSVNAAAALLVQPALACDDNARHHSLYKQGHVLLQRQLIEARERDQKLLVASATRQANNVSDRITHLYEQGRVHQQRRLIEARERDQKPWAAKSLPPKMNVFERLAPTPEKLTSAESARKEKRETHELDGATFKPQRLAAANDVTRRVRSDLPPGSARHVARVVPGTAMMRNVGAAGGGLGATTRRRALAECTFAPKVRVACVRRGGVTCHMKDHMKNRINGCINNHIQRSHPRIASKDLVSDL